MEEKKPKLSKKQKEVIGKMKCGQIIHWCGGIKPMAFMPGDPNYSLSITTVMKLEDLKLIERTANISNTSANGDKLILTPLGKSVES